MKGPAAETFAPGSCSLLFGPRSWVAQLLSYSWSFLPAIIPWMLLFFPQKGFICGRCLASCCCFHRRCEINSWTYLLLLSEHAMNLQHTLTLWFHIHCMLYYPCRSFILIQTSAWNTKMYQLAACISSHTSKGRRIFCKECVGMEKGGDKPDEETDWLMTG